VFQVGLGIARDPEMSHAAVTLPAEFGEYFQDYTHIEGATGQGLDAGFKFLSSAAITL